jgi:hypothetical protein
MFAFRAKARTRSSVVLDVAQWLERFAADQAGVSYNKQRLHKAGYLVESSDCTAA